MRGAAPGRGHHAERRPGGRAAAWIVSPHLLVAQAATAALRSVGWPVEAHTWQEVVHGPLDVGGPTPLVRVVAIFDGDDGPGVVDELGGFVLSAHARVVVVTPGASAVRWGGLVDNNAVEVVSEVISVVELAEVVRRLTAGEPLMDAAQRAELRSLWVDALATRRELLDLVRRLSPQQRRVLELLASGLRVTEVAQAMGLAEATVRSHLKALRAKLGAQSQLEAVAMLNQVYELAEGHIAVPGPRRGSAGEEAPLRRR